LSAEALAKEEATEDDARFEPSRNQMEHLCRVQGICINTLQKIKENREMRKKNQTSRIKRNKKIKQKKNDIERKS
jgi:hypothetical protein